MEPVAVSKGRANNQPQVNSLPINPNIELRDVSSKVPGVRQSLSLDKCRVRWIDIPRESSEGEQKQPLRWINVESPNEKVRHGLAQSFDISRVRYESFNFHRVAAFWAKKRIDLEDLLSEKL